MGYTTEDTPCCAESFAAAPGWDAVSGLGSPNFGIISNLVINNASSFPADGAYPAGTSFVASNSVDDDDDEADYDDVAVAALCMSLLSLLVVFYALYKAKSVE